MYIWEDKEQTSVMNTITGERNIRPGNWRWNAFQKWMEKGGEVAQFSIKKEVEFRGRLAKSIAGAEDVGLSSIIVKGREFMISNMVRTYLLSMAVLIQSNRFGYHEMLLTDGTMTEVSSADVLEIIDSLARRDMECYQASSIEAFIEPATEVTGKNKVK